MSAAAPQHEISPVPPQLPEEEFWVKYNDRLEFPLSTVGAVFLHVMVGVVLFLVLSYLMGGNTDKATIPITFIDDGGDDDFGQGSEGGGGDEIMGIQGDPLQAQFDANPTPNIDTPQANPTYVPEAGVAPSNTNPSAFSKINTNPNSKAGVRPGGEGVNGKGPGGSGNDATRARQANWSRWVISFSTFESDGRDYINQLGAFGATLIVPRPGGTEYIVYDDVLRSLNFKSMSKADAERAYQTHLWFSEDPAKYGDPGAKGKSQRIIGDVTRALRLDFTPDRFWAVFPREVEGMLAAKENAFIDRVRSETSNKDLTLDDIKRTVFAVDRQAGGKQVEIVRIQLKNDTKIVSQNGRLVVGR